MFGYSVCSYLAPKYYFYFFLLTYVLMYNFHGYIVFLAESRRDSPVPQVGWAFVRCLFPVLRSLSELGEALVSAETPNANDGLGSI